MLQQTQVATVIPLLPALPGALSRLSHARRGAARRRAALWSGLGYYARAQSASRAQVVVAEHGGEFPRTSRSCRAARHRALDGGGHCRVRFGAAAAILDGNVKRVLARAARVRWRPRRGRCRTRALDLRDRVVAGHRHRGRFRGNARGRGAARPGRSRECVVRPRRRAPARVRGSQLRFGGVSARADAHARLARVARRAVPRLGEPRGVRLSVAL